MSTLLFIVGSAQRYADGVADYTFRLAEQLKEKGVHVRILAWNDAAVGNAQIKPDLLRLPSTLSWRSKLNVIKPWYDQASPDNVSLQFVPYAFSFNGFPTRLAQELAPVIAGKPLHVFMHELWVMPCMHASLLNKIKGVYQRKVVLDQLKKLNPSQLDAALPLYVRTLQAQGFSQAKLLPLFGNIETVKLKGEYLPNNERRIGLFGSIYHPIDSICEHLGALATQTNIPAVIRHAGMLNDRSKRYWQKAKAKYESNNLRFERIGKLSNEDVARYFKTIHFLASPYSPIFYPKSGVVAAAREHGLPVWLTGAPELSTTRELPEGLTVELPALQYIDPPKPTPYFPLPTVTQSYYYFTSH